jgi:hypothetical protein
MTQKAKMGGWPTKAPIGYLNVREESAGKDTAKVVLDPERALLAGRRSAYTRPGTTRCPSFR